MTARRMSRVDTWRPPPAGPGSARRSPPSRAPGWVRPLGSTGGEPASAGGGDATGGPGKAGSEAGSGSGAARGAGSGARVAGSEIGSSGAGTGAGGSATGASASTAWAGAAAWETASGGTAWGKGSAGIGADGLPLAYKHRLAGKPLIIGTAFEAALVKDGIDSTSVEGASTLPYAIPNVHVDVHNMETAVPVLWWRSVGHTHTAYSSEVVMDMLAETAGADPVAYRLKLLAKHPRHAGVLKLAAEKAGWGDAVAKGRGRGVAVHESFRSFVAQVVDVSVNDDGAIKVDRVVCAVDCGLVVNPDVVRAQMEGGIGYGLGAVMRNEITLEEGQVVQENFPDYVPLRISDMPDIQVHMVPSPEPPTGVGEPGVPPIGPALANAIYAATGKRVFTLPMERSGISFA